MKTYFRSFVASMVLTGATGMALPVLADNPGQGPYYAPAPAAATTAAVTSPEQAADQSQARAKEAKAKQEQQACQAATDKAASNPEGPNQAAASAACKTADVSTPSPQGAGTQIATKDPTSAKDALFSNQLTGGQTGGFSKDNAVPDSKSFTASADSAVAKFDTIKTSSVAPTVKSDVLTSKMSVNYQNYDANRVTRMVNSSDDIALAYNVAAKNNATMSVGMPVNSTDPKAPLRQAFINTMMNKYGWSAEKAAAFAGNLDHESNAFAPEKLVYDQKTGTYQHANTNAGAVAQGDYDKATGKYTSAGIAQFHNDRKDGMVSFVGAANSSKSELAGSLYDQFDYVGQVDAQKTLGSKNMAALDNPNISFQDKVGIVTDKYEIPKAVQGEMFGRMGGTSRYNNAVTALNEFGKETGNGTNMVVAANGTGKTLAPGSNGSGGVNIGGIQQAVLGAAGNPQGALNRLITQAMGGNPVANQLLGNGGTSGNFGGLGSLSGGSSDASSGGQYAGTTTDSGDKPYETIPLTGYQLIKAQEILKSCGEELPATDDAVLLRVARCKALGKTTVAADSKQ